jgi:hypothetical protein
MPPETSISEISQPPFLVEEPSTRNKKVFLVIVFGALATFITLTLLYRTFWHTGLQGSEISVVVVTPTGLPLFKAVALDIRTKKIVPIEVEGIGTAMLIDVVRTEKRSYYLIANQSLTEANLYSSERANPKAGLSQKTFSRSAKYSLSYDEQSNSVAYVSRKGSGPGVVTVLSQGTTTEKSLGEGSNPVLLKGGFFVVYQKEDSLVSVNISTAKEYPILNLPKGSSYAIDTETLRAVLYEPTTNSYQYFSLEGMVAASYVSSQKIEGPTIARKVALSGEVLVDAFAVDNGLVFTINAGKQSIVPVDALYSNSHLTIIHD